MSTALSHLFGIDPTFLGSGPGGEENYNYANLLKDQHEPQGLKMLEQITKLINEYVGELIDTTAMPEVDRKALKAHLLAAEEILLRNGNTRLTDVVSTLTGAILSRF